MMTSRWTLRNLCRTEKCPLQIPLHPGALKYYSEGLCVESLSFNLLSSGDERISPNRFLRPKALSRIIHVVRSRIDSFRPRRKVSSKLGNAGCLGVFDVVLHIYFARNP